MKYFQMPEKHSYIRRLDLGILGESDPIALWEEIIDQIPDEVFLRPNVKILSVASGHGTDALVIAERMIDLGIPMNTINDSIFLLDKFFVFKSEVQARYSSRFPRMGA
jgi:hypothetical protein